MPFSRHVYEGIPLIIKFATLKSLEIAVEGRRDEYIDVGKHRKAVWSLAVAS
jgi:hypothetical protein